MLAWWKFLRPARTKYAVPCVLISTEAFFEELIFSLKCESSKLFVCSMRNRFSIPVFSIPVFMRVKHCLFVVWTRFSIPTFLCRSRPPPSSVLPSPDICYNSFKVVTNIRWIFVTSDISYRQISVGSSTFHLIFVTTLLPANAKSDDHESVNHQLSLTTLSSIPESNLSIIKRNYRTNEHKWAPTPNSPTK